MVSVIVGSRDGIPDWNVRRPLTAQLAAPGELKLTVNMLMEKVIPLTHNIKYKGNSNKHCFHVGMSLRQCTAMYVCN